MPRLVILTALIVSGCPTDVPDPDPEDCIELVGVPNDNTGLDANTCASSCGCGAFSAGAFDAAFVDSLASTVLLDPPAVPTEDPYATLQPGASNPGDMCVLTAEAGTPGAYRMSTAASATGGTLTHFGACGLCSSLQNLSVYLRYPDLTEPVRACGFLAITQGDTASLNCIRDLGFDDACAQIWFYNASNTRAECLGECLEALGQPYHLEDGSLNACLQCDEDISGPVFKAVAGRTRRNSGLVSAICRPCASLQPVMHQYAEILGE